MYLPYVIKKETYHYLDTPFKDRNDFTIFAICSFGY